MGGEGATDSTNHGVQAALWIATAKTPPNGEMYRVAKGLTVPSGQVAIEREAW